MAELGALRIIIPARVSPALVDGESQNKIMLRTHRYLGSFHCILSRLHSYGIHTNIIESNSHVRNFLASHLYTERHRHSTTRLLQPRSSLISMAKASMMPSCAEIPLRTLFAVFDSCIQKPNHNKSHSE